MVTECMHAWLALKSQYILYLLVILTHIHLVSYIAEYTICSSAHKKDLPNFVAIIICSYIAVCIHDSISEVALDQTNSMSGHNTKPSMSIALNLNMLSVRM